MARVFWRELDEAFDTGGHLVGRAKSQRLRGHTAVRANQPASAELDTAVVTDDENDNVSEP